MTTPHDYYGEDPELHETDNDAHYIDPDYVANETKDQLPLISTIGRGQQGEGVTAEIAESTDDSFKFNLTSDETGQTLVQSPNLSAGYLTIDQPDHETVSGEIGMMQITLHRDGGTETYNVALPAGSTGSTIFTANIPKDKVNSNIYQFALSDLGYTGSNVPPQPRVNDAVLFLSVDPTTKQNYLSCGMINAIDSNQAVVVSTIYIATLQVSVDTNTLNWVINGVDSGIKSVVTQSVPTAVLLPAGSDPTVTDLDPDPLNMAIQFGIPKGDQGERGLDGTKGDPGAFVITDSKDTAIADIESKYPNAEDGLEVFVIYRNIGDRLDPETGSINITYPTAMYTKSNNTWTVEDISAASSSLVIIPDLAGNGLTTVGLVYPFNDANGPISQGALDKYPFMVTVLLSTAKSTTTGVAKNYIAELYQLDKENRQWIFVGPSCYLPSPASVDYANTLPITNDQASYNGLIKTGSIITGSIFNFVKSTQSSATLPTITESNCLGGYEFVLPRNTGKSRICSLSIFLDFDLTFNVIETTPVYTNFQLKFNNLGSTFSLASNANLMVTEDSGDASLTNGIVSNSTGVKQFLPINIMVDGFIIGSNAFFIGNYEPGTHQIHMKLVLSNKLVEAKS